jgi:RimJ/RimL family protein N-acetyltransferase
MAEDFLRAGSKELFLVECLSSGTHLRLVEPTAAEVRSHAAALAEYYNEPVNRSLMTNEHEFSAEDVVEHFETMQGEGGHPFLLFENDTLLGDCDLRHIQDGTAELAIMVGARARQAKGYGTRFARMLTAFAFERLRLSTVYASVRPENTGSLRMFEKLGYVVDTSPKARRYAEEDDDVCLSIDPRAFGEKHPTEHSEPIQIRAR